MFVNSAKKTDISFVDLSELMKAFLDSYDPSMTENVVVAKTAEFKEQVLQIENVITFLAAALEKVRSGLDETLSR